MERSRTVALRTRRARATQRLKLGIPETPVDLRVSIMVLTDAGAWHLIERAWIVNALNDRAVDLLRRRLGELMRELDGLCIDPEKSVDEGIDLE
jgi:hypothetical protein